MSNLTRHINDVLANHEKLSLYDDNRWFANEDIIADKTKIMKLLAGNNIASGSRIVIGYPNSYAFLVTYLACLEYGAVILPVNPNMPVPELHRFLLRSNAVAAFFTESQWSEFKADPIFILDESNNTQLPERIFTVSSIGNPLPSATWQRDSLSWSKEPAHIAEAYPTIEEPSDNAVAVILYTSGTTGKPKAVGLQHRHLLATAESVIESHQLTDHDTTYCFLPLFHINAQVVAFLSTMLSGGRIILAKKFSASRFWPTIALHKVTWVSAVPTIIAMLLNTKTPETIPASLRFVRSASAQLPELHAKRFEAQYGVPVIQSYGMTEAASQICVNPLPPKERRLGSVGVPTGVELMIADESGHELEARQVGEIAIRGYGVIDYYEEAESQKDFRDGWFHTGDLGYVDDEGYVFITGRKKEMINRAGEKVSPYEVEDVIREHSNVEQVAVIGLPDTLYGERVAAYVSVKEAVANEEKFEQELIDHCKSAISIFKCPSEVHVVDTIPTGATGKIQRTLLKSQVLSASSLA